MARIFFALIIVTAVLAQATLLPAVSPIGVNPDLALVLLLLWSALRGMPESLVWVFATGLLIDVLALDRLGTNELALLTVALLAGQARRRVFHSGLVVPLGLAIVGTLLHGIVLVTIRDATGAALRAGPEVRLIVAQALLNALLVPPLYLIASRMNRWVVQTHG